MSNKRETLIATEDFGTIPEDKKFQRRDRLERFQRIGTHEVDEMSYSWALQSPRQKSPLDKFRSEEPARGWIDQLRERLVRLILPQHLVLVKLDASKIDWMALSEEIKILWAQRTTSTSPEPTQYLLRLFIEEDK